MSDIAGEELDRVAGVFKGAGKHAEVHFHTGASHWAPVVHQKNPHEARRVLARNDCEPGAHQRPCELRRAGTVRTSRRRSSHSDQFWMYARSSFTISAYVSPLPPAICQYPVMPGRTQCRRPSM